MRPIWAGAVGVLIGALIAVGVGRVFDILARLDRIEQYLSHVSQVLRG